MVRWMAWVVAVTSAVLLLPLVARADIARLRCIADTNVSSYPSEQELNYGASPRLRLKGIEMLALMRFDTAPVANWRIRTATLYLRYAGTTRMLRTLGFSTVAAPWDEGDGSAERKPGECCFAWRKLGVERWAGPSTDLTDVTYTAGHTIAAYADVTALPDGWISVPVDWHIVQATIAGCSYGMAVSDEKGQTIANNDVCSREQSGSEPYLVVEGEPVPPGAHTAPVHDLHVQPDSRHADFEHGAVSVTFMPPSDAFNYAVRYRIGSGEWREAPRATIPVPQPGYPQSLQLVGLPPSAAVTVEVYPVAPGASAFGDASEDTVARGIASPAEPKPAPLRAAAPAWTRKGDEAPAAGGIRVWAYPDVQKAHPVSGNLLEEVGADRYGGVPAGTYRQANIVWDGRTVRLQAARNEFVAFHVLVERTGGPVSGVQVAVEPPLAPTGGGASVTLQRVATFRDWYVRDGDWYPEICVPLPRGAVFDIPAADNAVPGQRNQSLLVDLLTPRDAPPGRYRGVVTITAGRDALRVPIELELSGLTLPDRLGFDVSLNAYGTVGGPFGVDDRTAEYRAIEREYQRMAHLHRATLAQLGYSHTGNITSNYAPPLAGIGAATHVTDWSAWDAQFGPYLDGSAFADLPRHGVPVSHLYLPFHEAWPVDIRQHYRYSQTVATYPEMIAEHAMKAPPIEQAVDPELGMAFVAVVREFAQHLREKGWTKTQYQYYENDKYYYKDPKTGGRGTSWWLLDEPNHRDDWLALAYFGRLFREGMRGYSDVPMVDREDISRPQWQRDYLDGLVDLMCVGGDLYAHLPRLREMQDQWPVRLWNYASANPVHEPNVTMEAWAVRAWLAGADGIVPWQTIGDDWSYTRPDETALLLPGKRFGIMGPIASERLKALRRAQQDAEYLLLLAHANGWNRDQVAAAVSGILRIDAAFGQSNAEDAGRFHFAHADAASFAAMRAAIAADITGNGPL